MVRENRHIREIAAVAWTLFLRLSPIVVLALLAGVTTPRRSRAEGDDPRARAAKQCREICAAIVAYRTDHGAFPPGLQGDPTYNYGNGSAFGFGAEVLDPWLVEGGARYLDAPIGLDPWGKPFNYQIFTRSRPCTEVVVFSNGPDRVCDSWDAATWNRRRFNRDDIGACFTSSR